jgi:hypothetical protein
LYRTQSQPPEKAYLSKLETASLTDPSLQSPWFCGFLKIVKKAFEMSLFDANDHWENFKSENTNEHLFQMITPLLLNSLFMNFSNVFSQQQFTLQV